MRVSRGLSRCDEEHSDASLGTIRITAYTTTKKGPLGDALPWFNELWSQPAPLRPSGSGDPAQIAALRLGMNVISGTWLLLIYTIKGHVSLCMFST